MLRTTFLVLALLTTATRTQAAVPKQFSVQGVLRDKQGALQSTMLPMVARFLSAATGGTQYGSDYALGMVPVTNGLFTVVVPAPNILTDLVSAASVYLQLEINSEKYPPQPVAPNLYALMSAQADLALDANQLGGVTPAGYVNTTGNQTVAGNKTFSGTVTLTATSGLAHAHGVTAYVTQDATISVGTTYGAMGCASCTGADIAVGGKCYAGVNPIAAFYPSGSQFCCIIGTPAQAGSAYVAASCIKTSTDSKLQ